VIAARKIGLTGPVRIDGLKDLPVEISSDVNAIQLNRMRRQFINYSKMHTQSAGQLDRVPTLFVQFLNSNCAK
jgi:protein KTI12